MVESTFSCQSPVGDLADILSRLLTPLSAWCVLQAASWLSYAIKARYNNGLTPEFHQVALDPY